LIIIRGNRTQANAQSLCTLSAGYYEDGTHEDLMTDAQKTKAAQIMGEFVDKSDRLLAEILLNP
jgi:hypothetical protein